MSQLSPLLKKLPWLLKAQKSRNSGKGLTHRMMVVGRDQKTPVAFYKSAPAAIKNQIRNKSSVASWGTSSGTFWLLQMQTVEPKDHYGLFTPSPYAMARDLMGTCFRQIVKGGPKTFHLEYIGESEEEFQGLCVGMEMAQYRFKQIWPKHQAPQMKVTLKSKLKNQKQLVQEAATVGEATNLARLLVDLPPNVLQPKDYSDALKGLFNGRKGVKVDVWSRSRLEKEKMGLHIGVGQGSVQEPHMVHVSYRGAGKQKPIAFVGKGITFDTGGLDIKPAAGMRLMKKDMGGSASVAGIAYWAIYSQAKINCDFYFAIAENSVAKESFRPGDVLTARNGKTVEIHNTDAEGRLVMADSLTWLVSNNPSF